MEVVEDRVRQILINCAPEYEAASIIGASYNIHSQTIEVQIIHPLLAPVEDFAESPIIDIRQEISMNDRILIRPEVGNENRRLTGTLDFSPRPKPTIAPVTNWAEVADNLTFGSPYEEEKEKEEDS
jgi:hypothetical protein